MTTWARTRGCAGSNYPFLTRYERDNETELDFAQARYYSSRQGRFTSVDPLMASAKSDFPQSWNRYAYSFNDPLGYTDPSGMIAGDFYNLDGKTIGTDGVNDGMKYVVYDQKKVEEIENTTGVFTGAGSGMVTVGSAAMVTAIGDAVTRSDNTTFTGVLKPNETATGGFAEAGVTGQNFNGGTIITVAPNGPSADPREEKPAEISLPPDVDIKAHVHGSGQISQGGKSGGAITGIGSTAGAEFKQKPSPRDISNATAGTNIVVGAGNKTVYFYARTGNQKDCNCFAKMSLSNFLKIK